MRRSSQRSITAGGVPARLEPCDLPPLGSVISTLIARHPTLAAEAAALADVVVSTGGVSVGDFDFVKGALGAVDFWQVAMKPGKPLSA